MDSDELLAHFEWIVQRCYASFRSEFCLTNLITSSFTSLNCCSPTRSWALSSLVGSGESIRKLAESPKSSIFLLIYWPRISSLFSSRRSISSFAIISLILLSISVPGAIAFSISSENCLPICSPIYSANLVLMLERIFKSGR